MGKVREIFQRPLKIMRKNHFQKNAGFKKESLQSVEQMNWWRKLSCSGDQEIQGENKIWQKLNKTKLDFKKIINKGQVYFNLYE